MIAAKPSGSGPKPRKIMAIRTKGTKDMDRQAAEGRLQEIEAAVAESRYRRGMWQRFLQEASHLDVEARESLADDITRVNRKLHERHGFVSIPFVLGLSAEILLLVSACVMIFNENTWVTLSGAVLLTLCLQPLIKVLVGLGLGIRYDYAYLWYIEPRFKMQFGTYFRLAHGSRVLFHLAGGMGTPLATFIGYLAFIDGPLILTWLWILAFLGAVLLQVGAFVAEWFGVRMIGPFRLSTLTSPATAAMELKDYLGRSR